MNLINVRGVAIDLDELAALYQDAHGYEPVNKQKRRSLACRWYAERNGVKASQAYSAMDYSGMLAY